MRVLTLAVTPANSTKLWNTIYSYTASASTAYEGSTATFIITRDGSDQASSVYVNTSAYDASLGSDFQHLKGLKLDFGIGETEKSVNVEVYADTENEGTEYFYIDLYATAESAAAAGSDYIGWNWGTIKEQGGLQSKISLSATNHSANGHGANGHGANGHGANGNQAAAVRTRRVSEVSG